MYRALCTLYTEHFVVLRKKLVSYFASIKRGVTIVFNFENLIHLRVLEMAF